MMRSGAPWMVLTLLDLASLSSHEDDVWLDEVVIGEADIDGGEEDLPDRSRPTRLPSTCLKPTESFLMERDGAAAT